jgi:exonuclease SbcC
MIPIKLSLTNFLSHDYSEIDFTTFNTALILGSYDGDFSKSNGSGKSSCLKSLSFCLFDKTDSKKKDGVVKRDRKYCKVVFMFSVDDQTYRITRKRDKVISESEVILEQLEADGSYKDISCDTNTATNEKLETLIGLNYEVFVNSVYFKQNDVALFADATSGKRKDIIKSLLHIERWDEYQKRARDKAKILLTRIEEKRNGLISIDSLKEQLQKTDEYSANVKVEIDQRNTKYVQANQNLTAKRTSFQSRFGDTKDASIKLKQLTKEYADAQTVLQSNQERILRNGKIIEEGQKFELKFKTNIKALADKVKDGKSIDLNKINSSLLAGRTKERILKNQVADLTEPLKLGSECSTCQKPLTKQEAEGLQKTRQLRLNEAKQQHLETKTKLQAAERKAQELQQRYDLAAKSEVEKGKLELKLANCASSLTAATKENEQLTKEIQDLQAKNYEQQIRELKERTSKDEETKCEVELVGLEKDLVGLRNQIDRLNIEYGSLIKSKENLTKQVEQQTVLQDELNKLNAEYSTYDKLRDYFGKDGIQSVIIENVIDELENYTNDVLAKICNEPTTISIKTQKQSDNGNWQEVFDIEVSMGGRVDDLASFSGGEQFRVSMALRLALSRILAKRMGGTIKFLLLDEVDSSLDDKGIDLFVNVIKQLGKEMKVLIISHSERIKGMFDEVIVINKTAEGSRIVQDTY